MKLKDDLVLAEIGKTMVDATTFKQLMEVVNMNLLKGDVHFARMKLMNDINQATDQIINSSTISAHWKVFATLSDDACHTLKTFEITGLDIYYQYCSMADENKGAYWLSLDSEIKNPYLGNTMLTCGETIETIETINQQ